MAGFDPYGDMDEIDSSYDVWQLIKYCTAILVVLLGTHPLIAYLWSILRWVVPT